MTIKDQIHMVEQSLLKDFAIAFVAIVSLVALVGCVLR